MTLSGRKFVNEGVIVVTHIFEGVEGVPVVRRERNAFPDTQRQIWICDEVTSESDGIADAGLDGGFCGFGLEAAGCEDLPLEDVPELLGGDRTLFRLDGHVAFYTRLDDVQVGKAESVQLPCEVDGELAQR
jgi:hypothetical protein